jgi:hypothetical protein
MSHVDAAHGRIVHSANPLGAQPGALPQMRASDTAREECPDCGETRETRCTTWHGRLVEEITGACRCRRPRPIRRGGRAA